MSDLTAEQRIAAVQEQAKSVQLGEEIAEVSSTASEDVGWVVAAYGGPVSLAAYAAALYSADLGDWLAQKTNAATHLSAALGRIGLPRIGQPGPDGPNPATVGHAIAHSYALLGFLGSVVVGAVAAVAVGALIVATGGAAAVAVIGAAAAGGLAGGFAGTALGGALSQFGYKAGPIATGSPNVFIDGQPVARMTDTATCTEHAPPPPLVEGSETIFVNGLALVRVGHKFLCGAVVDQGAASVVVDSTTWACATPASEIPVWLRVTLDWIDFFPTPKPKHNPPKLQTDVTPPKPSRPGADATPPKTGASVDVPTRKPSEPPHKAPAGPPRQPTRPERPPKRPNSSKTRDREKWKQEKSALAGKTIQDFRNATDAMSAPKRGAAYEEWVKKNHPQMYGEGRRRFDDGTSTDGWVNSVKRQAWDHKHYKPAQLNRKFSGHAKKQLDAYQNKKIQGEIREFNYVFSDKPSSALVKQIQAKGGQVYYIDASGNPVLL